MQTYICANYRCGKEFEAKAADRKRGWAKCCSKACAAFMREKKLDRNNYSGLAIANGGYDGHDCNKATKL